MHGECAPFFASGQSRRSSLDFRTPQSKGTDSAYSTLSRDIDVASHALAACVVARCMGTRTPLDSADGRGGNSTARNAKGRAQLAARSLRVSSTLRVLHLLQAV